MKKESFSTIIVNIIINNNNNKNYYMYYLWNSLYVIQIVTYIVHTYYLTFNSYDINEYYSNHKIS